MPVEVSVGLSEAEDASLAFTAAAEEAAAGLDGSCDLCVVFVGMPHLGSEREILDIVRSRLTPDSLIGCGAGGVIGSGRELEGGSGAVVWALSAPQAEISVRALTTLPTDDGIVLGGLPDDPALYGDAMIVLADPSTFAVDTLLAHVDEARPAMPVIGGLASASGPGSASLLLDDEVVPAGAIVASLSGVEVLPCVSQGAAPIGPEMTVTAAEGNLITKLASKPALERLREVIGGLDEREQGLAAHGLLLGVVIDENQPSYERGDFLVRPIAGVDPGSGALTVADRVRVGQTVRLHVRDASSASDDLREALATRRLALGDAGAAGTLVFSCNGRGRHMFGEEGHDASALEEALGAPAAGFFAAGEIGPVGGRNFLHGFTATMAVFPRD